MLRALPGRLQAASTNEKSLEERLQTTQEELQDVSSTCRARMRWLDAAAADSARRVEQLFRCLQGAAPLEVRDRDELLPKCYGCACCYECAVVPASVCGVMQCCKRGCPVCVAVAWQCRSVVSAAMSQCVAVVSQCCSVSQCSVPVL